MNNLTSQPIVFTWFVFPRDQHLIFDSMASVLETMGDRARFCVVVDANDPIDEAIEKRIERFGAMVVRSDFPRGGHMDGGRQGIRGQLECFDNIRQAFPDCGYLCKIDCDTLLTGKRFLERVRQRYQVIGAAGNWRGFPAMWGMYLLRYSFIERILEVGIDDCLDRAERESRGAPKKMGLAPDWPDDQTIHQIALVLFGEKAMAIDGRPLAKQRFLGLWECKIKDPIVRLAEDFDFVHFGCRDKVTARAHGTMRIKCEMDKVLRYMSGGLEEGKASRLVIALGTGRCGSMSFADQMSRQESVIAAHEQFGTLPWEPDRGRFEAAADRLECRLDAASGLVHVDVAWYWIRYINPLRERFGDRVKFVWLRRPAAEVIRSYRQNAPGGGKRFQICEALRWPVEAETPAQARSAFPRLGPDLALGVALKRYVEAFEEIAEGQLAGARDCRELWLEDQNNAAKMLDLFEWLGLARARWFAVWQNAGRVVKAHPLDRAAEVVRAREEERALEAKRGAA